MGKKLGIYQNDVKQALAIRDLESRVGSLVPSKSKHSPELLAEWDQISYIAGAGSPVVTQDVSPTGKPCLKIVCTAYSEIQISNFIGRQYTGNVYVSGYGSQSTTGVGTIEMRVYQGSGTSNYKRGRRFQPSSQPPVNSYIEQGGDLVLHFNKENTTDVGTVSAEFDITQARLVINPVSNPCTFYLYAVGLSLPRKGRLCIVADDGWQSAITVGASIFNKRSIPITNSIIATRVGAANYATLNQLKAFVGAGNSCVAHGPIPVGGSLTSNYANASEAIQDVIYNRQYLADNDLLKDGGEACYIWPQGQYQWSSADLSLLDLAISNGFTHSRSASEMGVSDLGYSQNYDGMSKYQRMAVPIIGHTFAGTTAAEATNIANIITKIQRIASAGLDAHLMLHKFSPNSTPDGSMDGQTIRYSDAESIADAIKTEVDAGRLEVVLMNDLTFKSNNYWSGGDK